jgi:hypothetical protein
MGWLSVLPVAAALVAQAPAAAPPVEPVAVPIGAGPSVVAPPAPALQAPAPAEGATRWYGAPAVAADVAEVVFLYGVSRYDNDYVDEHLAHAPGAVPLEWALVISTVVSGAIVHGVHHQPEKAAASVLMRTGALLISAMLASKVPCGQEHPDCTGKFLLSIPLAVMAADDAFVMREPVPSAPPARDTWTPIARLQSGLAMLGVGASF